LASRWKWLSSNNFLLIKQAAWFACNFLLNVIMLLTFGGRKSYKVGDKSSLSLLDFREVRNFHKALFLFSLSGRKVKITVLTSLHYWNWALLVRLGRNNSSARCLDGKVRRHRFLRTFSRHKLLSRYANPNIRLQQLTTLSNETHLNCAMKTNRCPQKNVFLRKVQVE